jgi:hypothetical protein
MALRIASTFGVLSFMCLSIVGLVLDSLEEESAEDQDYFVDQATIDLLADGRATDHLVQLLREAVGSSDGVEISWQDR